MADRITVKRKLIEVALPLDSINIASAREKSIRHGHPSTLHMWWARRPLATCRAVLFASLVDDPSSDPDRFPTLKSQETERRRLFDIMERLVLWENTTNEAVLEEARAEIQRSTGGNPTFSCRSLLRRRQHPNRSSATWVDGVWIRPKSSSRPDNEGSGRNPAKVR